MSEVFGLVDGLGWLLALVAGATPGGANLDSTWPMCGVPAQSCPAADLVLARRLDEVETIGQGLALKAAGGRGLRPIAEHLGVPHTTARTWWRRFRVHSSTMLTRCTALAVFFDGTAVMLNTTGERAALDALVFAWQRAQVRFGDRVGRVWAFWSRISSGRALGTNTTSPWAGGSGADWIAPSVVGGPGP